MINTQWQIFVEQVKRHYAKSMIPLHEPTFGEKELEYVTDCIQSGWVSSVGSYVNAFEEQLCAITGVKHAIAVVNGTAALHIALKIAGVKKNDEVIMPSLSFVATANAAAYLEAVPHFVDTSLISLGIDPYKLDSYLERITKTEGNILINRQTGRIIKAVVAMHTFGHPVELKPLMKLCDKYNLMLIEDAAESLGSLYNDKATGSFGHVSAVSFNGNKLITTGGGGAILTNDDDLAYLAKHLTTTAKLPHQWEYTHDMIGYNYRMPNINAALGCAQLEKLDKFIEQKRQLTSFYEDLLQDFKGVQLFTEPKYARSNYWLQTLMLQSELERDEILAYLNENHVMSRPIWKPLHLLEMYNNCPRSDLSIVEEVNKRIINVPSTPVSEE
ncbi:LegC family aminotransferase [Paenibacillus campi]|uniref:LegC family aminotransferase n=1 Tax=Paenibacillus campi TaxID=3106031 RepID=UPI002AFE1472|nr:LegC family aminotransferase [Paenibacillus sp. SGZ-1014]